MRKLGVEDRRSISNAFRTQRLCKLPERLEANISLAVGRTAPASGAKSPGALTFGGCECRRSALKKPFNRAALGIDLVKACERSLGRTCS
jgi:hypothetical protein